MFSDASSSDMAVSPEARALTGTQRSDNVVFKIAKMEILFYI